MEIVRIIFRVLLIIFSAIVLGVSASLNNRFTEGISNCEYYNQCVPGVYTVATAWRYCIFVGAFGLIDALFGIGAAFAPSLWMVEAIVDALAAIFFVAGGGRVAALLAAGYLNLLCQFGEQTDEVKTVCTESKVDAAFLFLGFIAAVIALIFALIWRRGS